jgi:predicted aspartyl protease
MNRENTYPRRNHAPRRRLWRRAHTLACLVFILLAAGCATFDTGSSDCGATKVSELPITIARNFLMVPVTINDAAGTMLVDTGAEATTLTPEAAARLHIGSDPDGRSDVLLGVAGAVQGETTHLRELRVGGVQRTNLAVDIAAMNSFPGIEPPVSGLLGTDVLGRFDVVLDVPARRMALYRPSACGAEPHGSAVMLMPTRRRLALVRVHVNGRPLRALLDTGARTSLIGTVAAAQLGVTEAVLRHDPISDGHGIGLQRLQMRRHRFAEVELGGYVQRDMSINVAPLWLPGVDMLLGADWLASRRLWISYASETLFLR